MTDQPRIAVHGNTISCRTEAELSWPGEEAVAIVFDSDSGWVTEILNNDAALRLGAAFNAGVEKAKERLSRYRNRRGENAPEGLTVAGLSLWLLLENDGTALGMPCPVD